MKNILYFLFFVSLSVNAGGFGGIANAAYYSSDARTKQLEQKRIEIQNEEQIHQIKNDQQTNQNVSIDYQCVSDCQTRNYQYQLFLKQCSY